MKKLGIADAYEVPKGDLETDDVIHHIITSINNIDTCNNCINKKSKGEGLLMPALLLAAMPVIKHFITFLLKPLFATISKKAVGLASKYVTVEVVKKPIYDIAKAISGGFSKLFTADTIKNTLGNIKLGGGDGNGGGSFKPIVEGAAGETIANVLGQFINNAIDKSLASLFGEKTEGSENTEDTNIQLISEETLDELNKSIDLLKEKLAEVSESLKGISDEIQTLAEKMICTFVISKLAVG